MKKIITYYKLKKKLKLNDGTIIDTNTPLRFNSQEGPFLNLEAHEGNDIKRIVWVTEDQVIKSPKTRTETWSKSKLESHEADINETWLDQTSKRKK